MSDDEEKIIRIDPVISDDALALLRKAIVDNINRPQRLRVLPPDPSGKHAQAEATHRRIERLWLLAIPAIMGAVYGLFFVDHRLANLVGALISVAIFEVGRHQALRHAHCALREGRPVP